MIQAATVEAVLRRSLEATEAVLGTWPTASGRGCPVAHARAVEAHVEPAAVLRDLFESLGGLAAVERHLGL